MSPSEIAQIHAQVESGQYEEALGVEVGASRTQINRGHIRQLNRFREHSHIRESLNRAKGLITGESVVERARRLLRLGKRDEALAQLRENVSSGSDPEEHHMLGITLHKLGRDREALAHLEEAANYRGNATDYLWLGYTRERLGMLDEALESYGQAVSMRGAAEECRQLGNVLMVLERYDEALPLLNRAATLGSFDHELEERRRSIVYRQRLDRVRRVGGRLAGALGLRPGRELDQAMFALTSAAGVCLIVGGEVVGVPLIAAGLLYLVVR